MRNKYELERSIPLNIKREVRQRCGFGCIVCGFAIIEYHHFHPAFSESKEHNPNGITLLCPTCHSKVDKKVFDFTFIKNANENPCCKNKGFVKDIFYVGREGITFKLGSAWFKRINVITYDDEPLIAFSSPEFPESPFLLNATLYDKEEKEMLSIVDNEWRSGINQFDIETTSNELIIREKVGNIKLRLSHMANKEISITKMEMNYKGFKIQVENNKFIISTPTNNKIMLACPNIYSTLKLKSNGAVSF